MAKSGLLAQSYPAANTATLLYRAPIGATASAVLTASCAGTGASYTVGIKDYDQDLTLGASTHLFHPGDVISNQEWTLNATIQATQLTHGQTLTSGDAEKTAKFHSFVIPDTTTVYVKTVALRLLTLTGATGDFEPGDTLTRGTSPDDTTALVYESYTSGANTIIVIGPETINGAGVDFTDADVVSATSGGTGTISSGGVGTDENNFVFSVTTAGGIYRSYFSEQLSLFDDRTYVFDVSDTSMTGRTFRLSEDINGEWGPDGVFGNADDGAEYTAGKTVSGTPGQASAKVTYAFGASTPPTPLYFYDAGTGTAGNSVYGGSDREINITSEVTYNKIRVYDVVGTWVNSTDTFLAGTTTFTVTAQSSGKWGVVKQKSGTSLKISLGLNSPAFVATDTFLDAPTGETAQTLATVSAVAVDVTDIPTANTVVNAKALTANTYEKLSSLVIGPGQTVVVKSSAQQISYTLVGFEDVTTELPLTVYTP